MTGASLAGFGPVDVLGVVAGVGFGVAGPGVGKGVTPVPGIVGPGVGAVSGTPVGAGVDPGGVVAPIGSDVGGILTGPSLRCG